MTLSHDIAQIDFRKILLIRFARLGDVVLLVPSIRALRSRYPHARIDVLVDQRYTDILEMCSAVDRVIPVNRLAMRDGSKMRALAGIVQLARSLRREAYDLALDFHSFRETNLLVWHSRASFRLGLKRVDGDYLPFCFNQKPVLEDKRQHVASVYLSLLEPLGIKSEKTDIHLDLSRADIARAQEYLRDHQVSKGKLIAGFNVGAGSPGRVWPKEQFAALADRIVERHQGQIVLFAGPQEESTAREIGRLMINGAPVIAGNRSLRELAAVMAQCHVLLSNDTGPMHLGPAVGVPTLGLFTVGYPEHYQPLGNLSGYVKCDSVEQLDLETVYQHFLQMLVSLPK
ncbi:MAG: glycosyltransferase family 9 protein [Acidobacteria bacterium]|nr:glycosyltransferase family 9 protein [Acidobacteriota bacterium]